MKHLQETYRSPVTVIPSSLDKSEIRKTGTRNPEILLDPGSQFLPVVEGILSLGGRMQFCSTALVKLAMEGEYFTIHTHQFINHFCNLTSNWVTELYNTVLQLKKISYRSWSAFYLHLISFHSSHRFAFHPSENASLLKWLYIFTPVAIPMSESTENLSNMCSLRWNDI